MRVHVRKHKAVDHPCHLRQHFVQRRSREYHNGLLTDRLRRARDDELELLHPILHHVLGCCPRGLYRQCHERVQ